MKQRDVHYAEMIVRWIRSRDALILEVGGGPLEHEVLSRCGFHNVTISNLDDRMDAESFRPFEWSYQDAENLTWRVSSCAWQPDLGSRYPMKP